MIRNGRDECLQTAPVSPTLVLRENRYPDRGAQNGVEASIHPLLHSGRELAGFIQRIERI